MRKRKSPTPKQIDYTFNQLDLLFLPIRNDLLLVEKQLFETLNKNIDLKLMKCLRYLKYSGGKRIRPALVITSAYAASSVQSHNVLPLDAKTVAAAIELFHMASLIHDDIIDNAVMRHGVLAVHKKFGYDTAIVLADLLLSSAFQLLSSCSNITVRAEISRTLREVCEGELIQITNRQNFRVSRREYFSVIRKKTASVFAISCKTGALLANSALAPCFYQFGLNFGMGYQIIDDCLDIMGTQKDMQKSIGRDVKAGEITLPLLILRDIVNKKERNFLENFFSTYNKHALDKTRQLLIKYDVADLIKNAIENYTKKAQHNIENLPSSTYKRGLELLPNLLVAQIASYFVKTNKH